MSNHIRNIIMPTYNNLVNFFSSKTSREVKQSKTLKSSKELHVNLAAQSVFKSKEQSKRPFLNIHYWVFSPYSPFALFFRNLFFFLTHRFTLQRKPLPISPSILRRNIYSEPHYREREKLRLEEQGIRKRKSIQFSERRIREYDVEENPRSISKQSSVIYGLEEDAI